MMVFPLPIFSFLLAASVAALVWRVDFGLRIARYMFAAFFGVVALGALLVGLRFGYGVTALIPLQRALPLFAGPLLYLGFAVLALPSGLARQRVALHLGGAGAVAVLFQAVPMDWSGLDSAIAGSYFIYAVAIVRLWRKGPNHLIHARLDLICGLRRWMPWAAGFLTVMLLADSAIAVNFAQQRADAAVRYISYGSFGLIAVLLLAFLAVANLRPPGAAGGAAPPAPEKAAALERAVRVFLTDSQLYLDTSLTIERLAKRMHVPMRALSAAINQTEGTNVSQYVNGFRLAHAAQLLRGTDLSVTEIAAQSGFLTRSNFYREFQRLYAQTPAAYRQARG